MGELEQKWNSVVLRDLCDQVQYGYTASGEAEAIGPKFLRITDIVPDHIEWDTVPYCKIDPEHIDKYLLHEGDIVIARTGTTTGYAKYIKKSHSEAVFASYLVRLKLNDKVDKRYIGFIVESAEYKQFIFSNIGGAAQPNANAQVLTSFHLPLPSLWVQSKIASILSAYDDLIENNNKRIKILEEMARAIYREWFVNFRFSGHEKVKMVKSELGMIPEGWEVSTVQDTFEILGGGTPSKKVSDYWEDGAINWYVPSDLTAQRTMFTDESGEKISELGLRKSSARLFSAYSVMMTSRATLGVISINTTEACTNQGFITCIPNEKFPLYTLYYWLHENVENFISFGTGATFKEITKGVFKKIEIIVPPRELLTEFEKTVTPINQQVLICQRKIINLRKTRDLLLPKLISGEIDVEKLDIAIDELQ
jgi:type I restriction enzyme S subunit